MGRTIGKAGLKLIKEFEGCRLTAYQCSAGVWTIGYGHTAGVAKGQTITQAQAEDYLRQDCQKFADYVDNTAYVPITATLNDNQRDALISFAYNCGAGNLKKLCAGRTTEQIAAALTLYNKAAGKVLAGLVRRRKAEQDLFNTTCAGRADNPYTEPERVIRYKKAIMTGNDVKWIQWELQRVGYSINIDGKFGPASDKALRGYQKSNGLAVDGKCGSATRAKMKNC